MPGGHRREMRIVNAGGCDPDALRELDRLPARVHRILPRGGVFTASPDHGARGLVRSGLGYEVPRVTSPLSIRRRFEAGRDTAMDIMLGCIKLRAIPIIIAAAVHG